MSGSVDISVSCDTNGGCDVSIGVSASFAEEEIAEESVDRADEEFHGGSTERVVAYYKAPDSDLN